MANYEKPPDQPHTKLTLHDAKAWLANNRERGVRCPCCDQFAKIYKRPFNSCMAIVLIYLEKYFSKGPVDEWLYVPGYLTDVLPSNLGVAIRGGDWAKLYYWDMVERRPGIREDGSPRAGWWRITQKGRDFVYQKIRVPKYARVYNEECLGLVGPDIGISEALGKRFVYRELMES